MGLPSRSRDQDSQVTESELRDSPCRLSAFIEVEKTMPLNATVRRISLNASLLLIIMTGLLFNSRPVFALEKAESIPGFQEFAKSVQNQATSGLRGVYVSDIMALPVIQQPAGNAAYVSPNDGEITQFGMAAQFGSVGLLAHNNLSGKHFSRLAVGQEVRLVYGDGTVEYFIIKQVLQYQALQPNSPYSSFRDLSSNELLTAEQMFKRVYTGDRHVTFQTCITGPGSLSWGRLFVIATPKPLYSGLPPFDAQ